LASSLPENKQAKITKNDSATTDANIFGLQTFSLFASPRFVFRDGFLFFIAPPHFILINGVPPPYGLVEWACQPNASPLSQLGCMACSAWAFGFRLTQMFLGSNSNHSGHCNLITVYA